MTEDSMIGAAPKPSRQLRVPPALGEGLDAKWPGSSTVAHMSLLHSAAAGRP
jgi:hypothetical protein